MKPLKKISQGNLLIAIIAGILLPGCVTEHGAFKYYNKHQDQLAELCASKFPVRESAKPGTPVITTDTVTIQGDSIPCPEVTNPTTGQKTIPKVKCPDTEKVYVKEFIRDTIFKEDSARLKVAEDKYGKELQLHNEFEGKYNATNAQLSEALKTNKNHNWLHGISLVIITALSVFLFRK